MSTTIGNGQRSVMHHVLSACSNVILGVGDHSDLPCRITFWTSVDESRNEDLAPRTESEQRKLRRKGWRAV